MNSKALEKARFFYTLDLVTFQETGASGLLPVMDKVLREFGGELKILSARGFKSIRSRKALARFWTDGPRFSKLRFQAAAATRFEQHDVLGITVVFSPSPSSDLWDDLRHLTLPVTSGGLHPEFHKLQRLQTDAPNLTPTTLIIQLALLRSLEWDELVGLTKSTLAFVDDVPLPQDSKLYGRAHRLFYDEPLFFRAWTDSQNRAELHTKLLCTTPIVGLDTDEAAKALQGLGLRRLEPNGVLFGRGKCEVFDARDAADELVRSGRAIARYVPTEPK